MTDTDTDAVAFKYRCNKTFSAGRKSFLEGKIYDHCPEVDLAPQFFDVTIPPSDEVLAAAEEARLTAEAERQERVAAQAAATEPADADDTDETDDGDSDEVDDDELSYADWSKPRLEHEAKVERGLSGLSKASKQELIDALEADDEAAEQEETEESAETEGNDGTETEGDSES